MAVYRELAKLRGRVWNVLEWGSGLGVVTIMASRMGFDAYGIESEAELVEMSQGFAQKYGPKARFAQGSFIPDEFEWRAEEGDEVHWTAVNAVSAYDELEMELSEFELVYAFPWPDEHVLFRNIMRQCGHRDALLLSYDSREGIQLTKASEG